MTPTMAQPVLMYTRIAHNRFKTWLLVAFAIVSIIPFVLALSCEVFTIVMSEVGGRAPCRTRAGNPHAQEDARGLRARSGGS